MMRCWGVLLLVGVWGLAACGFQLRGLSAPLAPLPFRTLFLASEEAAITAPLQRLLTVDPRILLVSSAVGADAVLQVVSESENKDILTISRGGTVNQYQLVYRAVFRMALKGEALGPDIALSARRELSCSDQDILSKGQEAELVWNEMRQDVARTLLYRLSALKKLSPHPASAAIEVK